MLLFYSISLCALKNDNQQNVRTRKKVRAATNTTKTHLLVPLDCLPWLIVELVVRSPWTAARSQPRLPRFHDFPVVFSPFRRQLRVNKTRARLRRDRPMCVGILSTTHLRVNLRISCSVHLNHVFDENMNWAVDTCSY